MNRIIALLIAASASLVPARAGQDASFTEANQAYAAGDFRKAIDGYEQLVRDGRWSSNLFYDLGNAWYRAGDFGKAILNYERALALDPHQPEAEANLRLVRDQARALEMRPDAAERYVAFATANQWTIAAALSFWIAALVALTSLFATRRSVARATIVALALVVCGASTWAAWTKENGWHGRSLAIVIGNKTEARLATADTSASVLVLPPGSEVQIVSTRGDWTYAILPNAQRGWIPAGALQPVRL
ncbi:MAG: tetratricopeptide repeat protein [Chthoniobacterales bacterium]